MPAPDKMPELGPMAGVLHLNPAIAPNVPEGTARPLSPGEWLDNPNGSWSSEISATVQHPALNGGKPTIVPSMWIVDGKPVRVSSDQAALLAAKSGLKFPSFKSPEDAENFSIERERAWQGLEPKDAGKVPPLWTPPASADASRIGLINRSGP